MGKLVRLHPSANFWRHGNLLSHDVDVDVELGRQSFPSTTPSLETEGHEDVELGRQAFPSTTPSLDAEEHEDIELGGQSFPATTPSLEAEEHEDAVASTPLPADP